MKKIIIFGDSWSKGTWKYVGNNQVEVDKPALQLLSKKYQLSNFSSSGASNWESLISMFNYFHRFGVNNDDIILLCQTDLFRSLGSSTFDVDYQKFYKESDDLNNFYNSLCEVFYYKLENLTKTWNKQIYLIGGLSDVNTAMLKEITDKVDLISSSWIKLFDNQHVESTIPIVIDKNFMPEARKNGRDDLALEAFDISQKNFAQFIKLQCGDYMSNFIGDFHPTELGQDLMSKEILNYFDHNE